MHLETSGIQLAIMKRPSLAYIGDLCKSRQGTGAWARRRRDDLAWTMAYATFESKEFWVKGDALISLGL